MTKRMLIDSSHAEETRVVMLDGSRLEDYDVETATKKQLKGNIYLAKIVRVEPSLQAAFVEYGGNRHGFLAFGEIHPDYYQIPVADRQRLIALQEEEAEAERAAEEFQDAQAERGDASPAEPPAGDEQPDIAPPDLQPEEPTGAQPLEMAPDATLSVEPPARDEQSDHEAPSPEPASDGAPIEAASAEAQPSLDAAHTGDQPDIRAPETLDPPNEGRDDREDRRTSQRLMRHYKIQEVIRRRQIILVQVVKEERGTKGAALTTYISLAGRYCVLMPNSPRGGGVSRKITSTADRKRLKEITAELDIPRGMAMIVRTAGAQRPRPEIKRDCEYLLRLWDDIRDTTLASMAPSLIYEEASLIKRAIRDVYSNDVDEILVDGEEGWRAARGFMRMLMPTHANKVKLWREGQPLFARNNVEGFLDAMMNPSVQLRSGGYLVINQTEALVAIDVNSGRSTRERSIEETAVRTNLEAADEVARQLRLRDLAGLIVIDFIDMESRKNNAAVERRMKDALRHDRARIQVGSISHFGLMEMSRQRLRPSIAENSFVSCEHCNGTGLVRGIESASLHVLRAIEAAGGPRDAAELAVHVAPALALYILNNKRAWLGEIERRCVMHVSFEMDATLQPPAHRIVKTQVRSPAEIPHEVLPARPAAIEQDETDIVADAIEDAEIVPEPVDEPAEAARPREVRAVAIVEGPEPASSAPDTEEEAERKRKRRRRRRRGERKDDGAEAASSGVTDDGAEAALSGVTDDGAPAGVTREQPEDPTASGADPQPSTETPVAAQAPVEGADEAAATKSRRGRRSGRRRRRDDDDAPATSGDAGDAPPHAPMPAYTGPTPADPFNGAFDIFDVLAQNEDRYMTNMAASAASFEPQPELPPAAAPEPERQPEHHAVPEPESRARPAADPVPGPIAEPPIEPAAEPEAAAIPHADPEPVPEREPEPEPEPEPAVKPILVGAEEPAARRSGWWRR
jgi:ribonuclease E